MKFAVKVLLSLALAVLVCVNIPAASALDREAFTFTRYELNVRVEPDQQRLAVRGKIELRNDSSSAQKNVFLQVSSSLNWISVQLEGKPLPFSANIYGSDIDHTGALSEAVVDLPRPIEPKQTVELDIGYEGVIPQDATRLTRIGVPAEKAKHSDWDQIARTFTGVRGIGYVTWYPIATSDASLSDNSVLETVGRWKQRESAAEMKIKFTHSGNSESVPTLLCNGKGSPLVHEQMDRAYSIQTECLFDSLSTSVPLFVIGNYESLDRPAVNISYLPGNKNGADDYALAVDQAAPFVNNLVGERSAKPEFKAQVVELPDTEAAPFESGTTLLMPLSGSDTTLLLSAIHQLTSVAFPSPRRWISEGLASFAQVAYIDQEKGRPAAITYLESHRGALIEDEKQKSGQGSENSAARSLINATDEFYLQTKAVNVWWMLKDMLGETAFIAALHNYKANDDNSAYYMQKLIEAQAHRDLAWFFDDWVYRDRGLPDLRIESVHPREVLTGGYLVAVSVENLGHAACEVPVTVRVANRENTERFVVAGDTKASVRVTVPAIPEEAVVNDGSVPEAQTTTHVYKIEAVNH